MRPYIFIAIIIASTVAFSGCRKSVQLSGGMAPTIKSGEQVTIDYVAYAAALPRRWDIIAAKPPLSTNSIVIKRVIALPMETISLTTNGIIVNGMLLPMPNALTNTASFPLDKLTLGSVKFPYTVPPQHYFVIGDNWATSFDSRYYEAISGTNILGKVIHK